MNNIHRIILNQIVAWYKAVQFNISKSIGFTFFCALLCLGGAHAAVPVFTVGPSVHGVPSYGGVQFDVALNSTGNVAWFAVAAGAAVPTSAEVMAQTNYRGVTIMPGGKRSTGGGSPMFGVSIGGLSASTAYTAYFVADSGGGELQLAPTAVDFTTAPPDVTPPFFTAGPTVTSGPTHNSAGISLTLNESGLYYLIAVPAASAAPTSAEVKAGATLGTPYSGVTPKMGQYNYVAGGVAVDFSLMPLLDSSTAYKVYVIGEDWAGNLTTAPAGLDVTTTAAPPDTTPPVLTAGPTITSGPTHNFAAYSVTYDEPGHIYAIVVPAAAAAPTAAQVKAMVNYGAVTIGNHIDMPILGNTATTLFASFSNPSTAYTVYFVAEDSVGNLQATPSSLDVTTAAAPSDTTPPVLTAGPAITSGPTHNFATYSVTYDEPGQIYSIIVPAVAAAPTSAQVKAMVNYGSVTVLMHFDTTMLGNTAKTMMASLPSPSTAYTVYFVAEDSVGNLQATPSSLNVTTTAAPDVTPPALIAGPTILTGPTRNFVSYSVTYDESGSICSIVVPAAAAPPTAAQVWYKCLTGANYGDVNVLSYYFASMGGNAARTIFASFPNPSTAYTVYFVAEDSVGNLQATPSSLNVTTASALAVDTISPDIGPIGGGTTVTITGGGFVNGASVTIGGAAAAGVSWVSATSISATTPAGTAGAKDVVVTNPDTQSATLASGFTFASAPPYFLQQGPKLVGAGAVGASGQGYSVSVSADGNTAIVGASGDNNNMGAAWVYTRSAGVWSQQGAKLVGTGAIGQAQQGQSVSLSADGNTAMVGGYADDNYVGAVWVYTRTAGVWSQQGGKLVGTGASGGAAQGAAVSLSADGNTAFVGGFADGGNTGAAWVWTRSAGVWSQQGSKLVGTGSTAIAGQGSAVSLSADGNTALVGGYLDNSQAGAAWVYTRSAGVWSQQGSKLVGSGAVGNALQGIAVSLSGDGNTAIVGGSSDSSQAGAAWVYTRSAGVWSQQGSKLVGAGATGPARQGVSVSLTSDGNMAMIGGYGDNGNVGAAWVYQRSAGVWAQQGIKLVGTGATGSLNAFQGSSVSLSGDGRSALVGGYVDNNSVGAAWAWALAAPTVTSISPASGTTVGSTSVTITGSGFANGATATIGGTAATNVSWVSATSITATTPAGTVGAKDVVVTNPDTQSGTLASGFTYVTAITVTSISPSSGPTGGSTAVAITGTAFVNGATVTIGGAAATGVNWVSATSITANTPAGTVGLKDVVVTNSDAQSATLTNGFSYVGTPAAGLSPSSLTFTGQAVATTSAARTVTLSNTGNATLTIASIATTGDYAVTHDCGTAVPAAGTCTVTVTFTPTAVGLRAGSLLIASNATGSPHGVGLSGTGLSPNQPVCTLTATPPSIRKNRTSVLTSSCTNNPTAYSWTGGTCAGTTAPTCTVTPVSTTTYSVTGTNGNGSSTASATVTVITGDITPILFLLLFD